MDKFEEFGAGILVWLISIEKKKKKKKKKRQLRFSPE